MNTHNENAYNERDPWSISSGSSLEQRYEHLHRNAKAMWALLKSRFDLSDDDLRALLAFDPVATKPQLIECGVCFRPMQSTARCCLYCGTSPQVELRALDLNARVSLTRLTRQ